MSFETKRHWSSLSKRQRIRLSLIKSLISSLERLLRIVSASPGWLHRCQSNTSENLLRQTIPVGREEDGHSDHDRLRRCNEKFALAGSTPQGVEVFQLWKICLVRLYQGSTLRALIREEVLKVRHLYGEEFTRRRQIVRTSVDIGERLLKTLKDPFRRLPPQVKERLRPSRSFRLRTVHVHLVHLHAKAPGASPEPARRC